MISEIRQIYIAMLGLSWCTSNIDLPEYVDNKATIFRKRNGGEYIRISPVEIQKFCNKNNIELFYATCSCEHKNG